jgi:hypothetical protein
MSVNWDSEIPPAKAQSAPSSEKSFFLKPLRLSAFPP